MKLNLPGSSFQVLADGRYCLVLVFEAKALKLSDFEQRQVRVKTEHIGNIYLSYLLFSSNVVSKKYKNIKLVENILIFFS